MIRRPFCALGIAEGTVLIFENFEYRIKEDMP